MPQEYYEEQKQSPILMAVALLSFFAIGLSILAIIIASQKPAEISPQVTFNPNLIVNQTPAAIKLETIPVNCSFSFSNFYNMTENNTNSTNQGIIQPIINVQPAPSYCNYPLLPNIYTNGFQIWLTTYNMANYSKINDTQLVFEYGGRYAFNMSEVGYRIWLNQTPV